MMKGRKPRKQLNPLVAWIIIIVVAVVALIAGITLTNPSTGSETERKGMTKERIAAMLKERDKLKKMKGTGILFAPVRGQMLPKNAQGQQKGISETK